MLNAPETGVEMAIVNINAAVIRNMKVQLQQRRHVNGWIDPLHVSLEYVPFNSLCVILSI